MSSGRPRPRGLPAVPPALLAAALLFATPAAGGTFHPDRTPLPADVSGSGARTVSAASGTGNVAVHMVVGLGVVLALIFGLYWLLRRTARRGDRSVRDDGFMAVVSSLPLAPARSLHLVRVGHELVLVGSSEQSVTPVRVYDLEETKRLGLDDAGDGSATSRRLYDDRGTAASSLLDLLRKLTAR